MSSLYQVPSDGTWIDPDSVRAVYVQSTSNGTLTSGTQTGVSIENYPNRVVIRTVEGFTQQYYFAPCDSIQDAQTQRDAVAAAIGELRSK
jgi:hypothetical protein